MYEDEKGMGRTNISIVEEVWSLRAGVMPDFQVINEEYIHMHQI